MIITICKQKDGNKMEYLTKPFKDSHIFKYKFDNITYFHAYDDIEEIAEFLEKYEELNNYKDYFILFNGLITVEEFLKITE